MTPLLRQSAHDALRCVSRTAWKVHVWANAKSYALARVLENTQTGRAPPMVNGRIEWRCDTAEWWRRAWWAFEDFMEGER